MISFGVAIWLEAIKIRQHLTRLEINWCEFSCLKCRPQTIIVVIVNILFFKCFFCLVCILFGRKIIFTLSNGTSEAHTSVYATSTVILLPYFVIFSSLLSFAQSNSIRDAEYEFYVRARRTTKLTLFARDMCVNGVHVQSFYLRFLPLL